MPFFTRGQRLIIAFGGFVFFSGFVTLGLSLLGAFNIVEVVVILQDLGLWTNIFLGLGIINVITAILLLFRIKEI